MRRLDAYLDGTDRCSACDLEREDGVCGLCDRRRAPGWPPPGTLHLTPEGAMAIVNAPSGAHWANALADLVGSARPGDTIELTYQQLTHLAWEMRRDGVAGSGCPLPGLAPSHELYVQLAELWELATQIGDLP